MSGLSFDELRQANVTRVRRWHPAWPGGWSLADWGNAMAGEVGEACNVIKKLRRIEDGLAHRATEADPQELMRALSYELADAIIYADLIAASLGLRLDDAVREKFNITSEEHGFPERL